MPHVAQAAVSGYCHNPVTMSYGRTNVEEVVLIGFGRAV